ncbi:hypothetical protein [Hymenobacter psoromatis]|uniref:hypothetical protein n=1 Tax=Hymenobacter psoromatis TaxID=1484116 RepID=UPI001CBFE679|nr:hypothetical protein [Hymenobacter psoromatis]
MSPTPTPESIDPAVAAAGEAAAPASTKYKVTISRQTVDKLGVKMYDRAAAVVAELVANSYDADAQLVKEPV